MKNRLWRVFLTAALLLALILALSFAVSAEENEEVIPFEIGHSAESSHFTLSANSCDIHGWYAGIGDVIRIEAKYDGIVITAIDAIVGYHAEYYSNVSFSSGEKVEDGAAVNNESVHVVNINSDRLEISNRNEKYVQFRDITVYYTDTHEHVFSDVLTDNGDGTHSETCACGQTAPESAAHVFSEDGVCVCGAQEPVPYVYYTLDGATLIAQSRECVEYRKVTADTDSFENGTWYVVTGDVTVSERITVYGVSNLILADGATLSAEKGVNVGSARTLNVYAQTEGTGALVAASSADGKAAAIGASDSPYHAGALNVYGGKITAVSGNPDGAGIGGTLTGDSGYICIYDGNVTAIGNGGSAGIGGGSDGNGGNITVYGGTVTATGGSTGGAGIGGGRAHGTGGSVTVYGGTVTATGGASAAGIGGGSYCDGADVTVNGGKVIAIGGPDGICIGAGSLRGKNHGTLTLGEKVVFGAGDDAESITLRGGNSLTEDARAYSYFISPPPVSYVCYTADENGILSREDRECEAYEILTADTTVWEDGKWYVVTDAEEAMVLNSTVTVRGTVHLILSDGSRLAVVGGINVSEGNTLNVYSQSESTGELYTVSTETQAGIGGNGDETCGTVNIFGGHIGASHQGFDEIRSAAGIGGGSGGDGGNVAIYGGTVEIIGGLNCAGIGGGYIGSGGNVVIYDGKITVVGGTNSAGIGGGSSGNGGSVRIYGGNVEVTGGLYGAGIGGGHYENGGTVEIYGGTVKTIGGVNGAGIGGGYQGNGGTVGIYGGNVTVISGGEGRAIGAGYGGSDDGALTVSGKTAIRGGSAENNLAELKEVGAEKYVVFTPMSELFRFDAKSLSLESDFAFRFKGFLFDREPGDDVFMEFRVGKIRTVNVPLKDATVDEMGRTVFSCHLNVLELDENIVAIFHDGDYTVESRNQFSVSDYFDQVLALHGGEKEADVKTAELINAISNYAHYAQLALDETHGEYTVGEDGTYRGTAARSEVAEVGADVLAGFATVRTVKDGYTAVYGTSRTLILDAETAIILYFSTEDAAYVPTVAVTDKNGNAVDFTCERQKNGKYKLTIPGVAAHMLADGYTVDIDSGSIVFTNLSVLSYAYSVLSGEKSDNYRFAMSALYDYYTAAVDYIRFFENQGE